MAEEDGANDAAASQQDNKQQFAIRKIYMRDMSFESPNAPAVFQGEWRPQVSVDLDTRVSRHGEDTYETILRVTVTAKQEDQTAYVAEVEQAGLFVISGFDAKTLDALLGSYCPAQLFPFAREAIADMVAKGGFPQMMLAPVNFEAMYMQQRRQKQEAQAGDGDSDTEADSGQEAR